MTARGEGGNVLFIILLAVGLFAALSYAVMQSDSSGGAGLDRERASMLASEILLVADSIAQGVQRMVADGVPLSSISTNDPGNVCEAGAGTDNGQANFCTSGAACLFAPEGGGVTRPEISRAAFTEDPSPFYADYFQGPNSHNGVLIDGLCPGTGAPGMAAIGVGTAAKDDILQIFPLREEVCLALNRKLGIGGIPVDSCTPGQVDAMPGKERGCVEFCGMYQYYQVLVPH